MVSFFIPLPFLYNHGFHTMSYGLLIPTSSIVLNLESITKVSIIHYSAALLIFVTYVLEKLANLFNSTDMI